MLGARGTLSRRRCEAAVYEPAERQTFTRWDLPTPRDWPRPEYRPLGSINMELSTDRPYLRSIAELQPPYSSNSQRVALSCDLGDYVTDWYPADLEGVALSEVRRHQFTGCTATEA